MKEWNENKLDQELEALLNEMPEQDEFEKRIEKYINRRIRKIVHKTLSSILVMVLVLLGIINPFLNLCCLNPAKTNEEDVSIYYDVMRDYYETTRPYAEIVHMEFQKKGFSRYEIDIMATNHMESFVYGRALVNWEMMLGKVQKIQDPNGILVDYMGRFDNSIHVMDENSNYVVERNPKEIYIEQLEKLPESSHVYVSLHTAEPQHIDNLRENEISLEWIEVYQPNVKYQAGLSMHLVAAQKETDAFRESMSEQELLAIYRSNLKNLVDHKLMWRQFELFNSCVIYNDVNLIDETYEDAKTLSELYTQNYCVYGTKAEVISYLENTDIVSVRIDKVTLF